MTTRPAQRPMTGRPMRSHPIAVLGTAPDGTRRVTIHPGDYRETLPYATPEQLDDLAKAAAAGAAYLRGEA